MLPDDEVPFHLRTERPESSHAQSQEIEMKRLGEALIEDALPDVALSELSE
jgi:hypothetical protein